MPKEIRVGDSMDDTLKTPKLSRHWRFLGKHGLMVGFSLASASLFMPTAKNTTVWELHLWLGLVFYVGLLFILDFMILRGRGRILTLLFILTGVAVVIEFPFSGIRRAQFRANYLAQKNPGTSYGNHGFDTALFGWEILHDSTIIPSCLNWRLVNGGVFQVRDILCTPSELLTHPKWFLQDADSLHIEWRSSDDLPLHPPKRPLMNRPFPSDISISGHFENDEMHDDAVSDCDLTWITNCVEFGKSESLTIIRVRFDDNTWQEILSSPSLTHISLILSNAGEIQLSRLPATLESLKWIDNFAVEPQSFSNAMESQFELSRLSVDQTLLTNELLDILKTRQKFESLVVYGIHSAHLSFPGPNSIERKFRLFIVGFEKLNLASPHVRDFMASAKSPCLMLCRLDASDLQAAFTASPELGFSTNLCNISSAELDDFGQWLVDRELAPRNPFTSTDKGQDLLDVFSSYGKNGFFLSGIKID